MTGEPYSDLPEPAPERWDGTVVPLATRRVGRPLLHFERVASTMPLAHDLAARGAADGTALIAEEQTAGRGRRERRWTAPPGAAILCSLVCRPPLRPDDLFPLSAVVSLGLCRAVEQSTGLRPAVKWPNDLLLDGRKVAGILTVARLAGGALDHAVVGFGLNVNVPPERLPEATENAPGATSLAIALGRPVDRLALLAALLTAIDDAYDRLHLGERDAINADWRALLVGLGEAVRVQIDGGLVEGRFVDVEHNGALVLGTAGGTQRLLVGDVILGPRPIR